MERFELTWIARCLRRGAKRPAPCVDRPGLDQHRSSAIRGDLFAPNARCVPCCAGHRGAAASCKEERTAAAPLQPLAIRDRGPAEPGGLSGCKTTESVGYGCGPASSFALERSHSVYLDVVLQRTGTQMACGFERRPVAGAGALQYADPPFTAAGDVAGVCVSSFQYAGFVVAALGSCHAR